MRKYLLRLFIFCVILLFFLAVLDYLYSGMIRKSNYQPVESWKDIMEGNVNADLVAVGSSRTLVQVDPHILDSVLLIKTYNLGMDGSHINRQVLKYEIYRNRNKKPKVIIQNIDAFTMSYRTGFEKDQFFPFWGDPEIRKMFFNSEPFTFAEKYIPFYRYRGYNPAMFAHQYPRSTYKGYSPRGGKWDGKAYMQTETIEFSVSDTCTCMFDSYLNKVKEDGVKVVFVYAPLYYGATQKISNIDKMHTFYINLAKKYDIPILDYSNMWISHDTTYFYNAMHLNKTGAEIFTDSLANDIKRLNII